MKNNLLHHIACICRSSLMLTALLACLSLTASAVETKYINSQTDWENFVKDYDSKTEVNVLLNCDVKFETQGVQIKKFIGTLDGQGHAFVFNYKDNKDGDQNKAYYDENWTKDSAPFGNATGTIKNLRLTGTVAIRYGFAAYRQNVPLVMKLENTLTLDNCHCDVDFVNTGTIAAGFNNCYIGGFIGCASTAPNGVTFNNCSFTGSYTYTDPDGGHDYNDTGGFIGFQSAVTVTITNCYSYFTYDDRGKTVSLGYFVGYFSNDKPNFTNSYGLCLNESGEVKSVDNGEAFIDLADYGGVDYIKKGGLTMALNAGNDGSNPWGQTIGTDKEPMLTVVNPESETLVNLVSNPYFDNNSTSWTLKGSTAAFKTDDNNNIFLQTSYTADSLIQTVSLTDRYTEAELSGNSYKAVMSCDWGWQYGYRAVAINYTFLDGSNRELLSYDIFKDANNSTELTAFKWNTAGSTITVPAGTRKVKITLSGQDYKNWGDNYGPAFDNVCLALVKTANQPTAITKVTPNSAVTDSRRYTLSGTPATAGTKGIIIQNGKKYVVK